MLKIFRKCFSREAAYQWFVVLVLGMMVRHDLLGLTSIIRALGLNPDLYETMDSFFRATSWQVQKLRQCWAGCLSTSPQIYRGEGRPILIGDGVKQAKEARFMVGVQKHHQESGNSASAAYIHGHLFGVLGVVTGSEKKYFCTPISASIHSGVKIVRRWSGETEETGSHVEQLVRDALSVAETMGSSFLVLDRYFLSSPALALLQEARATSDQSVLTLVTKAKSNVVAYTKPGPYSGRGRPSKKGETLHLSTLFETRAAQFQLAKVVLYGKSETVRYLGLDLLWGKGLYQELRFVLVERRDGSRAILVCSDTAVDPLQIIRLYSLRFKIEVTFRALKQDLAGFFYHFWSKSMPKLKRFTKKGAADPLESVVDPQKQQSICRNLKAIEGYVALQCIAQGLLHLLALRYSQTSVFTRLRYLRTYSSTVLSEASVMDILRRDIFRGLAFHPDLSIMRIIRSKQLNSPEPSNVHVA